jgi:hypothetical protein
MNLMKKMLKLNVLDQQEQQLLLDVLIHQQEDLLLIKLVDRLSVEILQEEKRLFD